MKSKSYIVFSLVAHSMITFVGQSGLAPIGIILYYYLFDNREMDTERFMIPVILTLCGYGIIILGGFIRKKSSALVVYFVGLVSLLVGTILLFTRNPEELSYGIMFMSAIPFVLLTVLTILELSKEWKHKSR